MSAKIETQKNQFLAAYVARMCQNSLSEILSECGESLGNTAREDLREVIQILDDFRRRASSGLMY